MNIIAFFLRHSRKIVLLSVAAGALSGICNAALLAVINSVLKARTPGWALAGSFIGLCLLLPFTRFTSERLLTKLGQEAMHRMRMQLCRQILAAPLLHLEQLGSARLLTALTDDIPNITNAVGLIPLLCVNVAIVIGLILFIFPKMHSLDRALLTGYALTLLYLMTPLQVTMNSLPLLTRANVALNKVNEMGFSLASQGSEQVEERHSQTDTWEKLQLSSVTHRYHGDGEASDFVLGPLDLTFKPGEMVFIIGGNGSGKTTFVKLLTGLYTPESGTIYLNGEPIGPENKEAYRRHFSAVFSDFYLFQTMFGLVDNQLDQRASEYLERLKLSHKVQIEKGKLSTTDLSQGQRKRLALLTAFLEDRPVYIFDEWAADQDPYFQDFFYMHLLPDLTARHKTVFVITHDDRYYHLAERIITLDSGQVIGDTARLPLIPETENRAEALHPRIACAIGTL